MEIRIEDIRTPPVPCADDDGRLPEASAPGPVDWKFLCERERVRAEDAEARCEELRWREVRARQRASSLDAVGKSNRAKLKAAREEVREVRRTAKRAVALEREAARLGRLLAEAGVDARKRSTVVSLRMENAALKAEVRRLRDRVAALEARNEELRSSRSSMSKSMFGSKSEKRRGEASKRKRGQQPGAPGHGRTPRPRLDETEERLDQPEDARTCSSCGEPYVANGSRESKIIEIEVKAHRRKIVRPRWRRGCGCASSPPEVAAEPPARLFPGTPFGISVWTHVLHEYAHSRYLKEYRSHFLMEFSCGSALGAVPGSGSGWIPPYFCAGTGISNGAWGLGASGFRSRFTMESAPVRL